MSRTSPEICQQPVSLRTNRLNRGNDGDMRFSYFTPPCSRAAEYGDEHVCLFVCLSTSMSPELKVNMQKILVKFRRVFRAQTEDWIPGDRS